VTGCAGGLARNSDGSCPTTTTTCPPAQVSVNGTCCNIRDYQNGHCGRTSDLCPNGKQKKDGKCPTTQECTGGKFFDGSVCRCKFGMTEGKNGQCVRSEGEKTKNKTCGQGTHLVNGECVRGFSNQPRNKSSGNQKAGPGLNVGPSLKNLQTGSGKSGGSSGGSKGKGN
jgi:hypothetical protein